MLDFYYLKDSEDEPEYPDDLTHIEGFYMEEFILMDEFPEESECFGVQLNFYFDGRITYLQTTKLLLMVEKHMAKTEGWRPLALKHRAYKKLSQVLKAAIANNSGLMCFCD
jgi:ribosomal protein L22